ncbi:MAG: radical SAM protein [Nitrososphaerales archaeon]
MDTIRTLKILGKWSMNRMMGQRRPLIAVFSLTNYCNFYCPMCPFGDPDKERQMKSARQRDLSTGQWKHVMNKVAPYCIWSIVEGGEPTSRKDILELLEHLKSLKLPVTMISNCSLLHTIDLNELRDNVDFVCCSIDSVRKESYCKVRGVTAETYERVMKNLHLLSDYSVKHYINSVITKWNTEEFITGEYFDFVREELDVHTVGLTFVEDRSDVDYSLLPDRQTVLKVCESVLSYMKEHNDPMVLIPPLYWQQIIEYGRTMFDECGVWKSVYVNGDGSVMVPCWKYHTPDHTFSLLEHEVDEIWNMPEWEEVKTCKDCEVLGCIWYSSQGPSVLARGYMRGMSTLIKKQIVDRAA